jgi:hypothetical protein
MNKYTNKLYKFLNNNFIDNYTELATVTYNYGEHPIIKNMKKIFELCTKEKYIPINLIKSSKINKLHSYDEVCLIYIIYLDLYNDKILQKYVTDIIPENITKNVNHFFEWYRLNQFNINLKKIIKKNLSDKKYKNYYEILYNPITERKSLHKIIYENMFISLDVVQHAESENLILETYSGNNANLEIYYIEKKPNVEYISKIISFFRLLTGKNLHVNLLVFYGKQKKYIPKNKYICSDNVNTGVTESNHVIMIWRQEEFYKVLIHELIHYFAIDFYINDDIYEKLNTMFTKKFLINGFDRVNESYTEALAMVIHSVMYSLLTKEPIEKILSYEIFFSHLQIAKILHHFGCDSFSEIFKTNMYQYTSVCSYYIIKCFFMMNYDILLNFWKEKGFFVLKNENDYEKIYETILNTQLVNEKMINMCINHLTESPNTSFETTTLRMSLFQL